MQELDDVLGAVMILIPKRMAFSDYVRDNGITPGDEIYMDLMQNQAAAATDFKTKLDAYVDAKIAAI